MKTPGRRGEIIKNEEIDKEFSKRYSEHRKRNVVYQLLLAIESITDTQGTDRKSYFVKEFLNFSPSLGR